LKKNNKNQTLNRVVKGEKKYNWPYNPPTTTQVSIHTSEPSESNKGILFSRKRSGGFEAL